MSEKLRVTITDTDGTVFEIVTVDMPAGKTMTRTAAEIIDYLGRKFEVHERHI